MMESNHRNTQRVLESMGKSIGTVPLAVVGALGGVEMVDNLTRAEFEEYMHLLPFFRQAKRKLEGK